MTAVLRGVRDALADRTAAVGEPLVTVGEGTVLVEVTHPEHGRLAGLAHRPPGEPGEFPTAVEDLVALATDAGAYLDRAVGVATLNALSAPDVDWQVGDPIAALSADVDTIATVGLFGPAFRKFDAIEVRVVERDPPESVDAHDGVTVDLFRPGECERAFAGADVCFITGSTLIYDGLGGYLSVLSELGVAPVVLVGATASHLPGPAFEAGVDAVAGARVTDSERAREHVAADDCATDLHEVGVEKVYAAGGPLRGLTLDAPGSRKR